MKTHLNCPCGEAIQGTDEDDLVEKAQTHLSRGASGPRIRPGRHSFHGPLTTCHERALRHDGRADRRQEGALPLGGRHLTEDRRHDAARAGVGDCDQRAWGRRG